MAEGNSEKASRRQRFDSMEQEAFLSLWRTYDRLKALEEKLFGLHDLTAQQYNALRLLRAAYPDKLPTLALAGQLISRAPDITRLLDKLVRLGYVERERLSGDRRSVCVGIAEPGLMLLDELAAKLRAVHTRQLGHLEPESLQTLIDLLRAARQPHERAGSDWR